MYKEIKTLDDLQEFVKSHINFCHRVFIGKEKDDQGNIIQHGDYWKGVNGAYINVSNAIDALKRAPL